MTHQRDLLARYRTRPTDGAEELPAPEPNGAQTEDPEAHVQRERRQLMLTLEARDGTATALAYSYLSTIRFKPSGVLELDFAGQAVVVHGVNLKPLFDGLRTHTTARIAESRGSMPREPGEVFVEGIEIGGTATSDGEGLN